jgi:hypothetical protein
MAKAAIDQLIINSPYEEPQHYWSYDRETRLFSLKEGRRPAGYVIASERSKTFDDPGVFIEIPLVNQIRSRVKAWRNHPPNPYAGVTGITKRLLEHWQNHEEGEYHRFFFCQMEAIETLIWLAEAPESEKVGIQIPSDGGQFNRLCSKMATGSGKTIVMAMLIAWQVLNKVTYPHDARFSKHVFVVAPGLTVKSRLQVLLPSATDNYYDEFNLIPIGLKEKLRQGKVIIRNWHALQWDSEEKIAKKKGVDKRGAKSNEAYVREVLDEMANANNIVVINDEAHHAWRVPAEAKIKGIKKADLEEATIWVNGLDRIHEARNVLGCYDIFGVPFTFLPHETQDGPPPPPKTRIGPVVGKQQFEIIWPNIIRIDHTYKPRLTLDIDRVKPLELSSHDAATRAELAPMLEGKPDMTMLSKIDLEELGRKFRMQKVIFETARDVFDQMEPGWKGNKEYLLSQLIRLVDSFIASEKIRILPPLFHQDDTRRRILLTLNMNKVVQHIWEAIRFENAESIEPIFDRDHPIRSTGDMQTWYTGKPCEHTRKSHINMCVFDSTWEASESFELDRNSKVEAWVKNDHLGFEILYIFGGVVRKYRPDFIIRLKTGDFLILETKGKDTQRDKTKREFLGEWVIAVNGHGGFGRWKCAVSRTPADVEGIIGSAVRAQQMQREG